MTIYETMKRINTMENNVKFKTFGKTAHTKRCFDKVPKVKYIGTWSSLRKKLKHRKRSQ